MDPYLPSDVVILFYILLDITSNPPKNCLGMQLKL